LLVTIGRLHLISALLALVLGAAVLWIKPKGTRRHRQLGYAWVACMLFLNISALTIYRLFGGFGPFHAAAIISLSTIIPAFWCARQARASRLRRDLKARARWLEKHYYLMTFSYVGLVAAAVSETATRLPATRFRPGQGAAFGLAVGAGTVLVMSVGAWLIRRSSRNQLAAVGAATRR
jgi:uncharacterized membrane protein